MSEARYRVAWTLPRRQVSARDGVPFERETRTGYSRGMGRLDESAALLTLLSDRTFSWGSVADEVEDAGSALAVFERWGKVPAQGDLFASATTMTADPLASARQAICEWESEGIELVTLLEPNYPQQLLTVHQRPPFLLYRGRLDQHDATGVAIVGTRKATEQGMARARTLAAGLSRQGVTVVSGLATGIDTAAHTAALESGGRTVAVIGTGLRNSYPAVNRALQDRIGREHLVISQFWPDAPPTKTSFPMRNAVMSGYSAATVVIEAAWKSGARMQARLALEHGRPVFLHDSLMEHDWARDYVARGAVVVRTADDVLNQLAARLAIVDELVWS
ncbi:MAG: processing protein [Pseudonocardiales bacterium]|nr:processing protein [Pseudonocardiales bacterium]